MASHADILDEQEHLAKPFWGSLFLHLSVAAAILFSGKLSLSSRTPFMGSPNGGGIGSVAVTAVGSIPLPPKSSVVNPVANDTESHVPAPPPNTKPQTRSKAPDPNAIPLKTPNAKNRDFNKIYSPQNLWRMHEKDLPNQLYSTAGKAASSPMFQMPGGGGVGVGDNSPFGTQFGWYATAVRDKVAQKWITSDVNLRSASPVAVTFTILRDGSVPPQSVKISQSSGNRALDFSAQRAVLDASPFGPLPQGFPRSDAAV